MTTPSTPIVDPAFQKIAREIVDSGIAKKTANDCGTSQHAMEAWAKGTMCPPNASVRKAFTDVMKKALREHKNPVRGFND